ncbi:MAG: alpha/beta hydrolase [Pseudomonadota bacterium]
MNRVLKGVAIFATTIVLVFVGLSIWHQIEPDSRVGQQDPAVDYLNSALSERSFQSVHHEFNDVHIHAAVGGNPNGPTLVFIHGFPSFWFSFIKQIEYFAEDFHIVAIDGLGANFSDAPNKLERYHLQSMSDHLLSLLDSLGVEEFHLVGHDWGSAWSLGLAQKYPDRIITVTGISAPPQNVILELVRTNAEQRKKYAYVERFKSANPTLISVLGVIEQIQNDAQLPHFESGNISSQELALFNQGIANPKRINAHINWYRANLPSVDSISSDRYWPAPEHKIDIPTLLIWGEADTVFVTEYLDFVQNRGKKVSVLRFDNVGHWPHIEKHAEVNAALRSHFQSE